jgi:hypothetical protein
MIRQREEQERIMDDKQARRRYARGKTRKKNLFSSLHHTCIRSILIDLDLQQMIVLNFKLRSEKRFGQNIR